MIELAVADRSSCVEQAVSAFLAVPNGDPCLVLRAQAAAGLSPEFLENLLAKGCGWIPDRRQISYELSLEEVLWWEITNDPSRADSYAYSTTPQPLHTDNAWFADPAEVNVFLMRRQAREGGSQTLYQVRQLVEDLQILDAKLLHDLATTEVQISKGEDSPPNRTRILRLGDEPRISWNYYRTVRTSPFVDELCERFFKFLLEADRRGVVKEVRLESGDCLVMADDRILHGRRAFSANSPGERSLLQSMWRIGAPSEAN